MVGVQDSNIESSHVALSLFSQAAVEPLEAQLSMPEVPCLIVNIEILYGHPLICLELIVQAVLLPSNDELLLEVIHGGPVHPNLPIDQTDLVVETHEQLVEVVRASHLLELDILQE